MLDDPGFWYQKKAETQLEDMKREYPSTPEEARRQQIEAQGFFLTEKSNTIFSTNLKRCCGRMPFCFKPRGRSSPA